MSSYTESQAHQLMEALESARFTPEELTKLAQFKQLSWIRGLVNGRAMLENISLALPIFKRVRLGTGLKTGEDFDRVLKANGFRGDSIRHLFDPSVFKVAESPTEVTVVALSIGAFRLPEDAHYIDACQYGLGMGLGLCPIELGPQLRLQYTDQPKDEILWLAMEAFPDCGGTPRIFCVADGLHIGGSMANLHHCHYSHGRLVFTVPN